MAHDTRESVLGQVQSEREQLDAATGLPFQELLDEETILQALQRYGVKFRDRIYNPMTTLWAFLSQAAGGKDSSCQDAVSRVIADRVARGEAACSAETTSYCAARQRLPEGVVSDLARQTGRQLDERAPPEWRVQPVPAVGPVRTAAARIAAAGTAAVRTPVPRPAAGPWPSGGG
jgi:hypothetical protein